MTDQEKLLYRIEMRAADFQKWNAVNYYAKSELFGERLQDSLATLKEAIAEYDAYMKDKESDQ